MRRFRQSHGIGETGKRARGLASPLLYGITASDPLTLILVSAVLLLVGATATWLPARRAAQLDPVSALRGE